MRIERWMQAREGGAYAQVPPEVERRAKLEGLRVQEERARAKEGTGARPPQPQVSGDALDQARDKKRQLVAEAVKLNRPTIDEGREFTKTEHRRWRLIRAELDVLDDEIEALEAPRRAETARNALRRAINRDRQWAEQVAVHEAGHALLHLLSGLGIRTVGLDVSSAGALTGGFAGPRIGDSDLLQSHVAGVAAERILLGSGKLGGSDLDRARQRFAERNTGADAFRLEEAIRTVETRLRPEWKSLRVLADRLLEVGQLEGAEAEEILKRHLTADGSREVSRMAGRTAWRATS